ncbi:MAG: aminotransferase class I/II-fold pyridoxal phosphate-dependent enzyme, partial [Rhizobium altiplani]|uniref:aminotransferase class I/II-fold pyridoxal phosphate-dependent enzyme n=2 Tax=Rhizobium TaxID=379 RepID=UPI0030F2AC83
MTIDVKIEEAGFRPASRISAIGVSEILQIGARAAAMKRDGKPVIILGAGEPDFETPDHVKQAAWDAMQRGDTKYTALDGTPALKEAIRTKFQRENEVSFEVGEIT